MLKAVMLIAMVCILCASADAVSFDGCIGGHRITFKGSQGTALVIKGSGAASADFIAITELYPDTPAGTEYHYTVSADGARIYERQHHSIGFGPETYFIRKPAGKISALSFHIVSGKPFCIIGWTALGKADLQKIVAKDSFRILGTTDAGRDDGGVLVEDISKGIASLPKYHITTGFSAEIRYANQPAEKVRGEIERCAKWSKQYSLQAMIGLVSWWSGTPLHEFDGQGGHFGDIKYQQICYTPETGQPEDANLKALLGDRYDTHYCLTVPNQWSSTPWLTMNSTALNDYRHRRMGEAAAMLKDVSKGNRKWIDNVYLENEPRYWDTQMEDGNDKRKPMKMWADFNPFTVAAARKDGVDLDPRDGLSDEEMLWLFRNVGTYNQETADAANKALKTNGFHFPVYTHSLQHRDMFPGGTFGHPASEWAFATGARSGIEGIWTQPSDFARMREWGRWANINREENDGRHIDEHLWDLRVSYMMGADLYNSYNWDAIGEGRFFAYVKEFLDNLPVVTLPAADVKQIDDCSVSMQSRTKMQAFTSVKMPAVATKAVRGVAVLTVTDGAGRLVGMSSQHISLASGAALGSFEFAEPVQLRRQDTGTVKLRITDGNGKPIAGAVKITIDAATPVEISLDLVTQRALSLAIISRSSLNPQL